MGMLAEVARLEFLGVLRGKVVWVARLRAEATVWQIFALCENLEARVGIGGHLFEESQITNLHQTRARTAYNRIANDLHRTSAKSSPSSSSVSQGWNKDLTRLRLALHKDVSGNSSGIS